MLRRQKGQGIFKPFGEWVGIARRLCWNSILGLLRVATQGSVSKSLFSQHGEGVRDRSFAGPRGWKVAEVVKKILCLVLGHNG